MGVLKLNAVLSLAAFLFLLQIIPDVHAGLIVKDLDEGPQPLSRAAIKKIVYGPHYFWDYTWFNRSPKLWGEIKLRTETRAKLELEAADFKDTMGWGFIMGRKQMRLGLACVDFILPCSEGELIAISDGHRQTFCGNRVPFNYVSETKHLFVLFKGNGGPYLGSIKCFISGLKAHVAEKDFFTTIADVTKCDDSLPKPPTYATINKDCECGMENSTGIAAGRDLERIFGGDVAIAHNYPWIAIIHGTSSVVDEFHCSGVLISDLWVLTTASCVRHLPVEFLQVNLGNHDTSDVTTGTSYGVVQSVGVGYNIFTRESDIMLLKLDTAVDLTASWEIRPICLPNPCVDLDSQKGYVAGWGDTTSNDDTASDELNVVRVNLLSNDHCNVTYDNKIKDTMICAGEDTATACTKDLGAPLWRVNSLGYAELIGIHSWNDGCGGTKPGVYTRITEFTDEIIAALQSSSTIMCQVA